MSGAGKKLKKAGKKYSKTAAAAQTGGLTALPGAVSGYGSAATKGQRERIDEAAEGQSAAYQHAAATVGDATQLALNDISTGRDQALAYHAPWAETGRKSMEDLYQMAQGNWDFKADPGYGFRLGEGEKAITRASGGGAGPYSGSTLKALQRFSQGLASEEYGNAYARREGTLGQLADYGQKADTWRGMITTSAAGKSADTRLTGADMWANYYTGGANAQAEAAMAESELESQAQSDVWGAVGGGIGMFG